MIINSKELIETIDSALESIGVEQVHHPRYHELIIAAYASCYLVVPVPLGEKITPTQIHGAMQGVANGLEKITAGLEDLRASFQIFDAARCTVRLADTLRAQALDELVTSCLRTIIGEIVYVAFPAMEDREEQIEATLPKYESGTLTDLRYVNAFGSAAHKVASALRKFPPSEFRMPPRSQEDHFCRFIGMIGEIYEHATGKDFSPHKKSDAARQRNNGWRPPSCQFVERIWPGVGPIWGEPPRDDRIRAAWETYKLAAIKNPHRQH